MPLIMPTSRNGLKNGLGKAVGNSCRKWLRKCYGKCLGGTWEWALGNGLANDAVFLLKMWFRTITIHKPSISQHV